MTRLRLIADDLTGALDSGCAFADPVNMVLVGLPGRALPEGPRVAVSTESRDMSEPDAVSAVADAVRELADDDRGTLWFKKIDSVMRGHPFAETKAALEAGSFTSCVFAPAYPDMGRITLGTQQYVVSAGEAPRPVGRDFLAALRSTGMRMNLPGSAYGGGLTDDEFDTGGIHIIEADSQEVLRRRAERLRDTLPNIHKLWVGAGGLAEALGGIREPAPFPPVRGVVVGTTHPATAEQMSHALANRSVWRWSTEASDISRQGPWLLAPVIDAPNPAQTAAMLAGDIARIELPHPERASIIVTGGDTLSVVLAATGADLLECVGQAVKGVPVSRIRGGRWHGLTLLSKSGGFGGPGLFSQLISAS